MCQLTQGTHAPLYSGLSSGLALCLFFLQWKGSSVYNSHLRPSLVNILPATAVRCANTMLFWFFFATIPPPPQKLHMKPFIPETKGVVKWFGVHVNSPAFMSQIPLRVTAFISCSSRGLQRERNLFKSAPQARGREKLISFNIMQTSITAGQKVGVLLKDQMDGGLGRGLWGALESVVVGLHR